jgi:hypothetical protein
MKKTAQLLAFLLLVSLAAVSATRRIPWNRADRPRVQLPQALQLAHEAVNMQEGLSMKDEKFYCIDAALAVTTSRDGDWTVIFGSKESGERWVIVDFDGRVTVSKGPFLY